MKGELAPFLLAARFTSFLGPGTHTTAPVDVSAYDYAAFEFWRGPLAGSGSTFIAYFEQADEPGGDPPTPGDPPAPPWFIRGSSVSAVGQSDLVTFDLTMKYLRMRIYLTGEESGVTVFAVGSLRRRIPLIG